MKDLFKFLIGESVSAFITILQKYCAIKYRDPIVCLVWGENEHVVFKTDNTSGKAHRDDDPEIIVRRKIGENILVVRGIPNENQKPFQAVLIPLPSLMKSIGIRNYINFIKQWKGSSKVGSIEVIRYSTLG